MPSKKTSVVPTGEQIAKLLESNAYFMSLPKEYATALMVHIKNMPTILGSKRLSQHATFASLIKYNQFFYRYCLDNGLAEEIANAQKALVDQTPKMMEGVKDGMDGVVEGLGGLFGAFFGDDLVKDFAQMVASLQENLLSNLKYFAPVVKDPAKFLKENGVSEEQGLMWMGLSPQLAKRCAKEKVTIAELLSLEPGVIVFLPGKASTLS
jgi:hypothetical protein